MHDLQCYFVQDDRKLKLGWVPLNLLQRGKSYNEGFEPLQLFDREGTYVLQPTDRCPETGLPRHHVWYDGDPEKEKGMEFDHVIKALGMDIDKVKEKVEL